MTKWAGLSICLGVLLIVCSAAVADGQDSRPLQTLVEAVNGIFGSIFEIRTRMYFRTIRPQISKINFALRALTFRTSTALATKFRAMCGLGAC